MKLSAIDIGTNSIHTVLMSVGPDGSLKVEGREKKPVRLSWKRNGVTRFGFDRIVHPAVSHGNCLDIVFARLVQIVFVLVILVRGSPCAAQEQGNPNQESRAQAQSKARQEGPADPVTDEQEPHWDPVTWRSHYRRYHAIEGIITVAAAATSVAVRVVGPPEDGPRGGGGMDENTRDFLGARTVSGRLRAEDISDVALGLSVSHALLFDPLVNATWLRHSPDVGTQIGLINAEVLALTLAAQQGTANFIGRERPYGRTCGTPELDSRTHKCSGRDRYRSLFSGHTSVPFAMAAATCTHHAYLPLSAQPPFATCATAFALAATSGSLRIVSDNHYATDVLLGAATGSLIGFSVPLFHYWTGSDPPERTTGLPFFWLTPMPNGLQIGGAW